MDLARLFEAQHAASRRSSPGYRERVSALRGLEKSLLQHKDSIVEAAFEDFGGRAPEETLALELFPVLNEIRHAVRHLYRWMKPFPASVPWQFWPARARIYYQPLGVVGVMAPWNYSLLLSLGPVVGALAAGNAVMVKPSEGAPCMAELLQTIVANAFPPEKAVVITGGVDIADAFSRLSFDHLLFTGSTRVGRLVMRAASENLTPVTLELGGKSPALIHPSYPLKRAAERIIAGKLYNAGQTCVAPDFVLVDKPRAHEFVRLLREAAAQLYPTLVANPDYTRIINVSQYRRLASLVEHASAVGARVSVINPASELCNEVNRVFPPTIVESIPKESTLLDEEVFGPILPVVTYRSTDAAIDFCNNFPRPLAFYYFDTSKSRIRDVLSRTMSGGGTINGCVFHLGIPDLPFGGVGPSGMGSYHGFAGFSTFSHAKGFLIQGRWTPLSLLRPPFNPTARRIIRFLLGT